MSRLSAKDVPFPGRATIVPKVLSVADLHAYAQLVLDATAATCLRARELREEAARIRTERARKPL